MTQTPTTPARRARVLVCDDHPVLAEAIAAWAARSDGFEVAGAVTTCEAVLEAYRALSPDVVLMDISVPGGDGIATTRTLTTRDPHAKVLMFSAHATAATIIEALRAGAMGFLPKDTPGPQVIEAVRAAARGERVLVGAAAAAVVSFGRGDGGADTLTSRQLDVLRAAAAGKKRREISEELFISMGTVRSHLEAIYTRLGAHNVASAVAEARRRGLLE